MQLRDGHGVTVGKLGRCKLAPTNGAIGDLVAGVSQQPEQRWIDVGDAALEVADKKADSGGLDESAESLFALAQLFGGTPLVVYVGDGDDAAEKSSLVVEDGGGVE